MVEERADPAALATTLRGEVKQQAADRRSNAEALRRHAARDPGYAAEATARADALDAETDQMERAIHRRR